MPLVNFANLDFDQVKESIIDYLKSNSNFTDYDFQGSNLSVILDVLAYNTFITSYNANMLSNEVFIDSATLRENVVSLAKNIGYTPRSRKSARTSVNFFVDVSTLPSNPLTLTLKAGIVATSSQRSGNTSFTFTIPSDITVPVVNSIANFNNITIFEGSYVTENFTVDPSTPKQRFLLGNPNIDIGSLRVQVSESAQSNSFKNYNLKSDLFDVDSTSEIYFIQEISDERYEIIFGDDIFGKKLDSGNFITASYSVTNGDIGNNISQFSFSGRILDNNGNLVTSDISNLFPTGSTSGGQEIESVDSIRKIAPRKYSAQNRTVTAGDYEALIPQIYPEADSVSAVGGEDLTPPRFGRIYITIKPINGLSLSTAVKDNLKEELKKYSVAGIIPVILDAKFLFIEFDSKVFYDPTLSSQPAEIIATISENVKNFAESNEFNQYGSKFKYSKFLKLIDDSDDAITSNITSVFMRRDLSPTLREFSGYEICFGNKFNIDPNGFNLKTSGFRVSGISNTVYFSDEPNSDGKTGNIFLFKVDEQTRAGVILRSVGTIDYERGEILIDPIKITETKKTNDSGPIIEFSIKPSSNDIIGKQELYLQLDISNSTIDTLKDNISSGADISGSNFIAATSSGNTRSLIRN